MGIRWIGMGRGSWTHTDGILIRPNADLDYDFYIDDIRLSDSRTVEFNALTGGAIGQIACRRSVLSIGGNGSPGLNDTWFQYDHIGNVVNTSNSSGVVSEAFDQDAWGNVLSSGATGAWASTFDGRH